MRVADHWARLNGWAQRQAAVRLYQRPSVICASSAIISFTFDDFPRTALTTAGTILKRHSARGTYYTALGLMGQDSPSGKIFNQSDLGDLIEDGHELGCHTFDHYHSWNTTPAEYEASVLRNKAALARLVPAAKFQSHSYPISYPRPGTKRRLHRHFPCCRCGGQTMNAGLTDLSLLRAFFLEQCGEDVTLVRGLINQAVATRGWLIFATHDVCEHPSRYGCTPDFFEKVVTLAEEAGALILPVGEAWSAISNHRTRAATTAKLSSPGLL